MTKDKGGYIVYTDGLTQMSFKMIFICKTSLIPLIRCQKAEEN